MEPQVAKAFADELSVLQDKYNNINKIAVAATKVGVQYIVHEKFVDESTYIALQNVDSYTPLS